jgi:hypothetical protein
MRNILVIALLAAGCAAQVHTSRGLTRAEYQGGVHLVFTNASPVKMCELRMSSDAQPDYGDNWLPEAGLASGASLKLNVRPGTYKAMWSTCPTGSKDGYYAGTLWHDTAVEVSADTQLYAYVAEAVAPTKRAPLLGVDYTVVRFQGQAIGPIAKAIAHPAPAADGDASTTVAAQPTAKFGAAAFIDPTAARKSHHAKSAHPSLGRTHDVTTGTIAYHSR